MRKSSYIFQLIFTILILKSIQIAARNNTTDVAELQRTVKIIEYTQKNEFYQITAFWVLVTFLATILCCGTLLFCQQYCDSREYNKLLKADLDVLKRKAVNLEETTKKMKTEIKYNTAELSELKLKVPEKTDEKEEPKKEEPKKEDPKKEEPIKKEPIKKEVKKEEPKKEEVKKAELKKEKVKKRAKGEKPAKSPIEKKVKDVKKDDKTAPRKSEKSPREPDPKKPAIPRPRDLEPPSNEEIAELIREASADEPGESVGTASIKMPSVRRY